MFELVVANGGFCKGKPVSPLSNLQDGLINVNYSVISNKSEKRKYIKMFNKGDHIHNEDTHQLWTNSLKITFEKYKKDASPIELVRILDNLPLTATYTNEKGVKYIMSHAGFLYSVPEEERDYLWDRSHYVEEDKSIPQNTI